MQEFPPSEDYFWMDTLTRCKVTLLPFSQSKLTLQHWRLHQQLYMQYLQCRTWHSLYMPNEIPEYSTVLGMHQSTCTCTTIQIICRTALIHPLSETQHRLVQIWDWYLFVKLSWNRVQSSKRWDVHVQWGSFHWPCFHKKAILKSKQTNHQKHTPQD